jgi:adenylate cyclase
MPQNSQEPPKIEKTRGTLWNIQWNIVSIFLVLLSAFALILILYTHHTSYQSILDLSITRMQLVDRAVIGDINRVTGQAQLLVETTKGLITKPEDISDKNQALISYLLNALNADPVLHCIQIINKNGDLIAVDNLTLSKQTNYALTPAKALPSSSKYAMRIINRSGPTLGESHEYRDINMQVLDKEQVASVDYDPRTDIRYTGILVAPQLQWSTPYSSILGEIGIVVSVPVFDANGVLFAVVSVNLSLDQLSNLITHEQIGESGRVFVSDKNGQIIMPSMKMESAVLKGPSLQLASIAYEKYIKTKQTQFIIVENETKYLVKIGKFPLNFDTQWITTIIVPFNDFFGNSIQAEKEIVIISLSLLVIFSFLVYFASRYISSPIVQLAQAVDKIQHLDFSEKEPIKSRISEIVALNASFTTMRIAMRSFMRYVPKEIVKTLIEQGKEIEVGGERRELTVMFSDIENFTTVSESLAIETLTSALSEYFEALSNIIVESSGTIDKYVGDSIMAFWNAPNYVTDHADKACKACLRCLELSKNPDEKNILLKGRTRFGIHSGEVIVGNIGTTERLNYTVIGNVVNTASRLESLNKEYHTSIIISESVHEKIGTRFVTRPLDFVVVKGRTKGITIFELIGVKEGDKQLAAKPDQIELCEKFTVAYEQFHAGKTEEAKNQFLALQERFPNDMPTKVYLNRIQAMFEKRTP